jgi:ribosomal protein S18 acetylase RimI-like enzyme
VKKRLQVIAFVIGERDQDSQDPQDGANKNMEIVTLAVKKQYRKQGLGQLLVESVLKQAREGKCSTCTGSGID